MLTDQRLGGIKKGEVSAPLKGIPTITGLPIPWKNWTIVLWQSWFRAWRYFSVPSRGPLVKRLLHGDYGV